MTQFFRTSLLVATAIASVPASAQLTAPVRNGDTTIVVTGTRQTKGKKVEMSDWRMAETPHVIVFSRGDEKELVKTAHNLEKLHFLLSVLLNRVDAPDETIKIAVTMIGDTADFDQLRLTNLRWQNGPYPKAFPTQIYYDPREEGPVLATTGTDAKILIEHSLTRPSDEECSVNGGGPAGIDSISTTSAMVEADPQASGVAASFPNEGWRSMPIGEVAICQSNDSRLYAGFAQNFLMTYFPAAYPRWYLQGFGEMFATINAKDGEIEYGRAPEQLREVFEKFGSYRLDDVLNGKYLAEKSSLPDWTPYHAWRLVHLLFFSEEWKQPLHNYLAAVATGRSDAEAAPLLGDLGKLRRQLGDYHGRKVPFERMTFPAERAPAPLVRQLTRAEAGLIRGRLELGARIEVPAASGNAQSAAIARREAWLARLRDNAQRFPAQIENHLLLAEAECRSGHAAQCLDSADRALGLSPTDTVGLVWKGVAMAKLAAAAPAGERQARLKAARSVIARANRADTGAILPLIAYYNSFIEANEAPNEAAVAGLMKTVDSVPAAPKPRLPLGKELVKRGEDLEAQRTLLPVARGAFETPEQQEAEATLRDARPSGAGR